MDIILISRKHLYFCINLFPASYLELVPWFHEFNQHDQMISIHAHHLAEVIVVRGPSQIISLAMKWALSYCLSNINSLAGDDIVDFF